MNLITTKCHLRPRSFQIFKILRRIYYLRLICRQLSVFIIHVILSGVLIGRETITSLQINAYE